MIKKKLTINKDGNKKKSIEIYKLKYLTLKHWSLIQLY